MTYAEDFELLHDGSFHHDRTLKMTNKPRQGHVHALEPVDPIQLHDVDSTPVHTYDIIMNNIKHVFPRNLSRFSFQRPFGNKSVLLKESSLLNTI